MQIIAWHASFARRLRRQPAFLLSPDHLPLEGHWSIDLQIPMLYHWFQRVSMIEQLRSVCPNLGQLSGMHPFEAIGPSVNLSDLSGVH